MVKCYKQTMCLAKCYIVNITKYIFAIIHIFITPYPFSLSAKYLNNIDNSIFIRCIFLFLYYVYCLYISARVMSIKLMTPNNIIYNIILYPFIAYIAMSGNDESHIIRHD